MSPIVKKLRTPLGHPLFYLVILLSLSLLGISCLGDFERDNPLDPKYEGGVVFTSTPSDPVPTATTPPPPGWIDRGQFDDTVGPINNEMIVDNARYPGASTTTSAGWWLRFNVGGMDSACGTAGCAATNCATMTDYNTPAAYIGGTGLGLTFVGNFCSTSTIAAVTWRCFLVNTAVFLNVSRYTGIECYWEDPGASNAMVNWGIQEQSLGLVQVGAVLPSAAWTKKQVPFTDFNANWHDVPRGAQFIQIAITNSQNYAIHIDELRFY